MDTESEKTLRVHLSSEDVFAFAGSWDEWTAPDDSPVRSCAVITTALHTLMSEIHNRMPEILRPQDDAAWLDVAGNDRDGAPHLLGLLRSDEDGELAAPSDFDAGQLTRFRCWRRHCTKRTCKRPQPDIQNALLLGGRSLTEPVRRAVGDVQQHVVLYMSPLRPKNFAASERQNERAFFAVG